MQAIVGSGDTIMKMDTPLSSALRTFRALDCTEAFFAAEAPVGLSFGDSLAQLFAFYDDTITTADIETDSAVVLRLHLSDVANQHGQAAAFLEGRNDCFISFIGQPPASGSKIALEAYLIKGDFTKRLRQGQLELNHGAYTSLWSSLRPSSAGSSGRETAEAFSRLTTELDDKSMTLEANLMRTWIYIHDIDHHYQDMVDVRRELFERHNLTPKTHFVASTGIEGTSHQPGALFAMDSLALGGIEPDQVHHMQALDHLCPTHEYNVTFERGTRITFGDRSHHYLSGTASIDAKGQVVHKGNVARQTERTLKNMEALLADSEAQLSDLRCATVYLRDIADYDAVREVLDSEFPKIPHVIVKGPVCRPSWLVEIEGIAVNGLSDDRFPPFCAGQ